MDGGNGQDLNQLLRVLAQGQEKTRQLEASLDEPSTAQVCKSLAQQIESTFHTAISMMAEGSQQQLVRADSPPSAGDSPHSEGSDRVFKDYERMEMCKRRKSMPRWSRQVRVCSAGGGTEEPLVDGYSWRKYGQKDILGSMYPRGYYRCTHRNTKGCLATKQVQRSDEDPSIFDVTYRGLHTCTEKRENFQSEDNLQQNKEEVDQSNDDLLQQLQQQQQDAQLLQSLRAELEVKTEDIGPEAQMHNSSSFSFPPTPASCVPSGTIVSRSAPDDSFGANFSPTFVSEPNYFSLSQCQISNHGGLGAQQTEHAEATSATATSMANSPMADIDFVLRQGEYGTDFPFDGANFF
ncbi:putative WRKY transcription factor 41 [Iris pallida]|uniref:WRKY transcription factor 41 n=1 Tax=Iris pallida TaxID=29817 RepID=A0AAX6GP45_IRIPA|nr:putative WRKY transcription factor 41 [Iris pallida]